MRGNRVLKKGHIEEKLNHCPLLSLASGSSSEQAI